MKRDKFKSEHDRIIRTKQFRSSRKEDYKYIQDFFNRGGIRLKLSKHNAKISKSLIKLIIKATIDKFQSMARTGGQL